MDAVWWVVLALLSVSATRVPSPLRLARSALMRCMHASSLSEGLCLRETVQGLVQSRRGAVCIDLC